MFIEENPIGEEITTDSESASDVSPLEESLKKENDALKDRLFRALAELENDRKRFLREKEEITKFAITGFARDLLTIMDNLARALESTKQDSLETNGELKVLHEGVSMTDSELKKILEKHKIESIDPAGQKFDHNEHQAVFDVSETDVPEGMVVQVLQKGYKLGDRLLRPAMVSVSRKNSS